MPCVEFFNVTKTFAGAVTALDNFALSVAEGELVVVVGPSGAGKTTALRIVAGLERATSGSVCMDGLPIDRLRPKDRDVAMVFQQPALYSHLNVRKNIAFSLRMRGVTRPEAECRVAEVARSLGVGSLLDRWPDTLSGGQAQRVALAKAFVRHPKCLLLDEPFASLDAPLRGEMRQAFRAARRQDALTTLFVTHDQDEALALADRLVVIRAGRIEQLGTSRQVYDKPANRFVAGFLGSPPMNFLDGRIVAANDEYYFESPDMRVPIPDSRHTELGPYLGHVVTLGIRPEHWTIGDIAAGESGMKATVQEREFRGAQSIVRASSKSGLLVTALLDSSSATKPGTPIGMSVCADRANFFTCDPSGRRLSGQSPA